MLNPRFSAGQDKFGTCSLQIRSMFVSMETNMKRRRKVFGAYLMYVFSQTARHNRREPIHLRLFVKYQMRENLSCQFRQKKNANCVIIAISVTDEVVSPGIEPGSKV